MRVMWARSISFFSKKLLCPPPKPILPTSCRFFESLVEVDEEREAHYAEMARSLYIAGSAGHQVLVVQPRIKWGQDRQTIEAADLMLAEAIALVETLPNWRVLDTVMLSVLRSRKKKQVFGPGQLDELGDLIKSNPRITAVFLNLDMVTGGQHYELSNEWGLPVYDRYNIVLHIFKTYAKTKEAKLQIALAEIPYLRSRLRHVARGNLAGQELAGIRHAGGAGEKFYEQRKRLLQEREATIKRQLEQIRKQRQHLRQHRNQNCPYPTIAVLGYTNCG